MAEASLRHQRDRTGQAMCNRRYSNPYMKRAHGAQRSAGVHTLHHNSSADIQSAELHPQVPLAYTISTQAHTTPLQSGDCASAKPEIDELFKSHLHTGRLVLHCKQALQEEEESLQLRADHMPGPPREIQVMYELFLDRHIMYISVDQSQIIHRSLSYLFDSSTKHSILMFPFF